MAKQQLIPLAEVRQHDQADDVWIRVNGEVYNMTGFAPDHPGGAESKPPMLLIIFRHLHLLSS